LSGETATAKISLKLDYFSKDSVAVIFMVEVVAVSNNKYLNQREEFIVI
jgi:hypothetical protein